MKMNFPKRIPEWFWPVAQSGQKDTNIHSDNHSGIRLGKFIFIALYEI